ncbi:MAG: ATP-binding protein [Eubacteriales bacterium]|nr:ATP-binding protein [Eubacteriales bacterium]
MEKAVTNSKEHILVCLSPAPSNTKIIQTAAAMAKAFNATFSALYVKTPASASMTAEDAERLLANIRFSETSGASVVTVCGNDIAFQIAEYARLSGVTKVVIGRTVIGKRRFIGKPTLTEKLISLAPNVDIHIIPDSDAVVSDRRNQPYEKPRFANVLKGLTISAVVLLLSSLLGWLFFRLGFTEANIITIYILGVLLIAIFTESKICWVVASVASVLIFNFLFTEPKFTFLAYGSGYPVTFIIMLTASLIIGGTTEKLKTREYQATQTAYRTKILFDANQLIQKASDETEVLRVTANQLKKLLNRNVIVFDDKAQKVYATKEENADAVMPDCEQIVLRVTKNNVKEGKGTDIFPESDYTFFPICKNGKNYGAIGIFAGEKPIDSFDESIVVSVIGECAIVIDGIINAKERERVAVFAKNEQLRANLLRSISHDLRTPLTSISGNASNLISNGNVIDNATKTQIYEDIYSDSLWLINLVENLLAVTRLEEGRMNINLTTELVGDVIAEALKHIHTKSEKQKITVIQQDDLLLAKMDARLIVQVLINLLDNAVKYTPSDSQITITAKRNGEMVCVSVADNGHGIPDEQKSRVFDMFYTGSTKIADSRRSIGLGLSLCKSIINAHGGEINVTDNTPHGAIFTFTLPAGEVEIYE